MIGMPKRGKIVALSTVAVGVVVMVVAGFYWKDLIEEQWDIHRIQGEDQDEVLQAIYGLGKLKSLRGVPHILEIVRRQSEPSRAFPLSREGRLTSDFYDYLLWESVYVLRTIGKPALPRLIKCYSEASVRSEGLLTQSKFMFHLGACIGLICDKVVPELIEEDSQTALIRNILQSLIDSEYECEQVRQAAAGALKKIQGEVHAAQG